MIDRCRYEAGIPRRDKSRMFDLPHRQSEIYDDLAPAVFLIRSQELD